MRVELIDTIGALLEIKHNWEKLLSDSQMEDIFLLPQWLFSWWKVFGKGKGLFFVTLWEGRELFGLFPLCKVKKGPFRVITFAGRPADRMDFILAKDHGEECIEVFYEWIFSRDDWDLLSLRNFGCSSKNPELLDLILGKRGKKRILVTEEPCFFIVTSDYKGFEDYFKTVRSPKTRNTLRRKKKRVKKYHNAKWKVLGQIGPDLLDEMEELDLRRSIRGLTGSSFFQNPLNKIFLQEILKHFQKNDMIRVFTFQVGGRLCAYELDFKFREKILFYQTSFDETFHNESIGILTLLEAIKYVFENRYKEYDFLTGAEEYKSDWTNSFRQCRRLLVYRGGIKASVLYLYHRRIKPLRRRVKDQVLIKKLLPKNLKIWDI